MNSSNGINPFPGIRPFDVQEKYLFFGREDQTAELLTRLRKTRFLAVVGSSGSGKSSLVRAGLIPELHGGTMAAAGSAWEVAVMKPGGDPLTNLAQSLVDADLYDPDQEDVVSMVRASLSRSGMGLVETIKQSDLESKTNLLLVVDQFEEIFRFRRMTGISEEEAGHFIRLLLEASQDESCPIYVVLTMRSDFLGDCAQFGGLAEAVNEGEYIIPRLNRSQRKQAIEAPSRVGGREMSNRLVQRLLNDISDDPDQLPILQHALMRTWEYWVKAGSEGPVDLEHYQATGGMTEALSRHADEVFQSLPNGEHRRIATLVFKSLTEKVSENRGIRRPMQLNELHEICGGDIKHLLHVIDEFRKTGCTFLMPAGESELQKHTIIDISHESLMRVWRALRLWVDDEAQSAKIYRRLADTSSLFKDGKAGLYRDPDLGIALAWRDENQPNQTWADRYYPGFAEAMVFLDKSQAEEEREEREKEEARKRELAQAKALANAKARTARIFKAATIGIALLAILCLVAFLQATQSKRIAEEKEILASAYLYDAQISLASKAIQDGNQGKAKRLLARYKEKEITENQPSWEWRFLWNECKNDFKREIGSHKDIVNCIAISPSNNLIATGSADKTLKVINLETESETNFDFSASVTSAQFTDDEKALFYMNENEFGEIRLDSMSVAPTHIPISGGSSFEISGNGQWISVVSPPNLLIYNTITEEVITVKQAQARWDFSSGMSYSSDNKKLAWRGGQENPGIPIIYYLETKTISEFKNTPSALKTKSIMHLEFHPNNETIIATHWGGYVSRWDAIDMSYLSHFKAHNAWVSDIIFITNGEEFITSSADQSIKLWKTKDLSLGANMTGHTGEVWAIVASSDEQILYSTGKDHSIKEWEIKRFKEQSNEVSVTNNHVGSRLINGGINYFKLDDHNLFEVFESSSMERIFRKILPITHHEDGKFMGKANRLRFFAITPSHGLYAFINDKKELVVSDVEGTNNMIFADDLSFESSNVWEHNITFSTDGRLIKLFSDKGLSFYDAQSGDLTRHINLTNPSGISYSDDEKYGLFRANNESPFVYSFEKDEIISTLDLYNRFIPNAAFSKDGKYVATVSDDATTRLWEVATGKQLNIFRGQLLSCHDVAFASDGKRLFVGNGEGTVKVWNTETGNELITIEANDGEIVSQVKLTNDQTLNVISGIEGLKYRKFEVSAFNNQNTDIKIE